MNFKQFINSPQIRHAISSNDPLSELEKMFGSNPFAKNVINLARKTNGSKQLEVIANNIYTERNMDIPTIDK